MSWIEIPNWERFQHYGLARRPIWIKNYTALLHKDEYLDLSLGQRGLLHGIWLAYAETDGRLPVDNLRSKLSASSREDSLEALNNAGFIDLAASRPLLLSLRDNERPAASARQDQPASLQVVRNSKRDQLHGDLLDEASRFAQGWNGGGSDAFDERLDELERAHAAQLSSLERIALWDLAFKRPS